MDPKVDDVRTAVGVFERAVALGSDQTELMANALRGYAVALERTESEPPRIIDVFERLVKLQPHDPLLWFNLAKLQIVAGTHTQETIYNNLLHSIETGGESYRDRMLSDPLFQLLVQQYPQFGMLIHGTPTPGLVPLTTAASESVPVATPLVK